MLLQKAPSHLRTLADCHMIGLLHMYHSVCLDGTTTQVSTETILLLSFAAIFYSFHNNNNTSCHSTAYSSSSSTNRPSFSFWNSNAPQCPDSTLSRWKPYFRRMVTRQDIFWDSTYCCWWSSLLVLLAVKYSWCNACNKVARIIVEEYYTTKFRWVGQPSSTTSEQQSTLCLTKVLKRSSQSIKATLSVCYYYYIIMLSVCMDGHWSEQSPNRTLSAL